jgi:hypothetical protein
VCDYFRLARRVSSAYRFESSEKGWVHVSGRWWNSSVCWPPWDRYVREGAGPGVANFGFLVPERGGSAPGATIRCVPFLIGEPPEKSSPPSAPLSRAVTHLPDLTSAIIKRLLSYYSNTADFVVLMAQTSVQRRQALEECLDTTVHPTWPSEILFSWDFLVC